MSMRALIIAGLLDVALAAAVGAAWLQADSAWQEPAAIAPDPATLAPRGVDTQAPDAAALRVIAERPLFIAGRRPIAADAPAEAEAEAAPDPLGDVKLVGMVGGGQSGIVIVNSGGALKRVRVGEALGPWTVQAIDGRRVRFARGEAETRELTLAHAAQRAQAARPPARAAAPAAPANAPAPLRAAPTADRPAPATDKPAPAAAPATAAPAQSIQERIAERRARRDALRARAQAE